MIYARPFPFREALDSQEARRYLPTELRTGELEQLDASLLRRAMFSAQVTDVEHLQEIGATVSDVISGNLDRATARLRIKQYLQRSGYVPTPEKQGTLEDFSSDARTNLQIDTNVEMMRGLGNYIQGQQADVLDMWPAQELVRVIDSRVPRDWLKRWDDARAATTADGATDSDSGRMVALKGHPIWIELSRFRNPWPPFDFRSGMGLEDRTRREAMALGLIDRDTTIFPDFRAGSAMNAGVQASLAIEDEDLKAALERTGVGLFGEDGVYRLVEGSAQ